MENCRPNIYNTYFAINDSMNENHHKILVTDKCTNQCNANVEARRSKDRNRKRNARRKRTHDQIEHDKLKDRLRKRKEKCQRTDPDNENHRIKNREGVFRYRERKSLIVSRPEDALLNYLQRCAYLNARTNDQKESLKEKARISHKIWRTNRNNNAQRRYNTKENERKRNVRTTKRHQKLFNKFFGSFTHGAESYKPTVFLPRFECRVVPITECVGDVLNICAYRDVTKHLCIIPLKIVSETTSLICYWPCLVFRGVNNAMLCHKQIYPIQHNIQLKLQMKLMQRSLANGIIDDDRFVVLPLANSDGCCPKTISTRLLYDVVDLNSLHSNHYWKTVMPKKGDHILGGNNIYQLLENFDVVRAYVREAKSLMYATSVLGDSLLDSLLEMERLCRLKL